jgi:gamma-glutamyltranspeptidase / glutathione hydrolase
VTLTQEQLLRETQFGTQPRSDLRFRSLPEAGPPRSVAMGQRGMVGSAHPLVSQTGLEVMRHGGNAVDAAVAAGAMLMLVEPRNGHLGADAFVQINLPNQANRVVAVNGSGAAPHAATLERYRALGGIPDDGPWASTVPGVVSAWALLLERFGSGAYSLGDLLQPAIDYAERGVPVTARLHALLTQDAQLLRRFPDAARVFLPDGAPPALGSVLRQPLLARSLRRIAAEGRDTFYTGSLAEDMVRSARVLDVPFTAEDFAKHHTDLLDPVRTTFLGYTVFEQPPVSQGIMVLLALNTLEALDIQDVPPGSAEAMHLQIEAMKLALDDRLHYLGDPAWNDLPIDWLLSKEHAREQAARVDRHRARPQPQPEVVQPDTTFMALADETGTMVGYIHSLFSSSGVVLGDTGVLLNNRLRGFNLEPGHPNCLAPGKRPVHTLNTYLVQKAGEPVLVGGTPGAYWQVQTNLQVLSNALAWGMDLQDAVEAPRHLIGESSRSGNSRVRVESRAGDEVIQGLAELGHDVAPMGPWEAGAAVQVIGRHPATGMYSGATEPRRLNCTVLGF